MSNNLIYLYNSLYNDQRYTKSFEEFKTQFEDSSYREKVYKEVASTGEYTQMFSDFEEKYYTPSKTEKPIEQIEVDESVDEYLPDGEILQSYLTQLEEINVTDQEMDDIIARAGEDAVYSYKKTEMATEVSPTSVLKNAYQTQPLEGYYKFPYQKFLDQGFNHTEAQQKWIEEEKEKLIVEKTDVILEEFESEISPIWEDIKGAAAMLAAGRGLRYYTDAEKEYKSGREYLTTEFNKKYKEKESVIVKTANDLQMLSEAVKTIDFNMSQVEDIFEYNKDSLSQENVDNYNTYINTRSSIITAYNAKLKMLNDLEAEAGDIATIGDLTKRTYNNFDILGNRLNSTALRLASGLVKLTKEVAGVGETIENVDYNSPEFLATMPEYIRPIVREYGKGLDVLDMAASTLYNEAEKINEYTARRQEFGEIKGIGDFGMFMLDLMSEQAINTAITYSTGGLGLAIISAGASGNKMSEMDIEIEKGRYNPLTGKMEDITISPLQYYTSAIGYGLAEYVTERVALENLKYGIKNYKKAFGLGSRYSLKGETFGKALGNYSFGTFSEGTSELTASVLQNSIDRYILENKSVNVMDGTNEAFWSGIFMSGLGFRAPGIAASAYKAATTKVDFDKINKRSQRIIDLERQKNQLLKTGDPNSGNFAESIAVLQAEIDGNLKANFMDQGIAGKRVDELSNKDKKILLNLASRRTRLQNIIDKINGNNNLSAKQREAAIADKIKQIDNMEGKKRQILNNSMYSKDADKLTKATIKLAAEKGLTIKTITEKPGENIKDSALEYVKNSDLSAEQKAQLAIDITNFFKNTDNVHGAAIGAEVGLPMQFQLDGNFTGDEIGNASVHSHELGHNTLDIGFLKDNPKAFALVDKFFKYTRNRYKGLNEFVDSQLEKGKYVRKERVVIDKKTGKKKKVIFGQYDSTTKEGRLAIAAEKLAFSIDYIRKYHNEDIDKSLKGKLLDSWRSFTKDNVDPDLKDEINNGEDVYNMLKDYASGFDVGRFSGKAAAIMDKAAKRIKEAKDSGKVTKSKARQSRSDLQGIFDTKYKGNARKMGRESIGIDPSGKPLSGTDVTKSLLGKEIAPIVNKIVETLFNPIPASQLRRANLSETDYRKALIGIASRIIETENFDPTIQGLDKFVSSRLFYRAKSLATQLGVPQEFTVDLEDAKNITNLDDVDLGGVDTQVDVGPRVVKELSDIDINNNAIEPAVIDKIDNLIEQNPKNLEEEITKLIEKDFADLIIKQMGEITGNAKDFTVSQKYKDFHNEDNYRKINDALSAQEIMNTYVKGKNAPYTVKKVDEKDYKNLKSDDPKLKKDSYYKKGVYDITATPAKWLSYFTEGGFTTLRDRRKKLAQKIAASFAKQAAQNYVIENSNNIDAVLKAELNKWIDSQDKQKSENRTFNNVKYSYGAFADGIFLFEELKAGKKVFDKNGNLLKKYKDIPEAVGQFVLEMKEEGLIVDVGDMSKVQFVSKALKKLVAEGKRGIAYEQHLIDQALAIEKVLGKGVVDVLLTKQSENDALPDFQISIYGNILNVEVKMNEAQYSSITFVPDANGVNGFTINKDYSFNDNLLENLGSEVQEGIKDAKDFLKKEHGYTWENIKVLPNFLHRSLKENTNPRTGKSYYTSMRGKSKFRLQDIAELYNNKKHAVHYIHVMGKGLFNMGKDILGFKLPKFEGMGEITIRRVPNSQKRAATIEDVKAGKVTSVYTDGTNTKKKGEKKEKRKVKTGNQVYSWRAIPTIPGIKDILPQSPHSIGTFGGQMTFFKSPEVTALKAAMSMGQRGTFDKAIKEGRSFNKPTKGITILDFDDTLATTNSLVRYTTPEGETGTLNAEQYALQYQDMLEQGYTFDFSEFNKVVDGKIAPLFQKALKLQSKFGPQSMFVLTARPPAAQRAIFDFLKANGLNIPLENITGLANSTSEAKALWVADKVGEGFNDFYFADDALQNVQAVKNMLNQFDVKSKVQQAKVKFSKGIDVDFNNILEDVTGVNAEKRFSAMKARKRGASKGKFRLFIPPSHEDLVGLLYNFMGKGKKGDAHRDFFEKALIKPLNRGFRELDVAKQAIANDYKALNKKFKDVKKKLTKKTPDGDYTYEDAIRVYLWSKHGYTIPGLTPSDQAILIDLVSQDPDLQTYAESINLISKQEKYVEPSENWDAGNIRIDLIDATGRVGRGQYFAEFQENADIMFSEKNLNKIEAVYGKSFRSALEDMLYRIKTGINRPKGQSATVNSFMNYLNGSVGTVMFFNVRSAILQQMSIVNYINFADNNIFSAAKAFANQAQYWKDFAFIFNSDMLKQRRGGIGTDINGAELAEAVSKSKKPIAAVISKLLQLGFAPTQIGDNIAIAVGGATFYRNRVNKYVKDGLSQKEAEAKAFTDFQDITQSTQQSSRPDKTSQQQAMWIGKLVLNFQNITSQYNRLIKRAAQDIYNKRITPPYSTRTASNIGNISRILYYGGIQNVIFYSLQTALFYLMFEDDEDDEDANQRFLNKKERVINGTVDSILRGSGIYGVALSTIKNMAVKWFQQREAKGFSKDESAVLMEALNFSPVVGIKARKIVNAEKTINYNENVISEMEVFDADNPQWSAATNYIEAFTNLPANRLYQKSINMRNALDNDYTAFQRFLFFSGFTTWSLGLGDTKKVKGVKEKIKSDKEAAKKKTKKKKRRQI